jgi:hypothetical protein
LDIFFIDDTFGDGPVIPFPIPPPEAGKFPGKRKSGRIVIKSPEPSRTPWPDPGAKLILPRRYCFLSSKTPPKIPEKIPPIDIMGKSKWQRLFFRIF